MGFKEAPPSSGKYICQKAIPLDIGAQANNNACAMIEIHHVLSERFLSRWKLKTCPS